LYSVDNVKEILRTRLSEKRYIHSLNVADECRHLAQIYDSDEEKAYFAGLVHDICKELPVDQLKQKAVDSNLAISKAELETKALWHAIAGAGFVKNDMKINDIDIINAVRFHTVARAGMTKLEEIVYIGDLISADRTYKDVKRFRKLAYQELDKTMLEAVVFSIQSVIEKRGLIPEYTIHAYNQYLYVESKHNQERK